MWEVVTVLATASVVPYCIWQNNSLVTTQITIKNVRLPKSFDGYTIVHISDLHNKKFRIKNKRLLEKIRAAMPDMIAITGDLIDRRRYNLDEALHFIEGALKIAPVYFVPGNHEGWSNKYELIKESLQSAGVVVLNNEITEIKRGNGSVTLIGLKDPSFWTPNLKKHVKETDASQMIEYLDTLLKSSEFKIVLSHRPELFDLYAEYNFDVVFTGHAHGGQFRLPLIGGLYAPRQGIFPKYTSGAYEKGATTMVVSRGLGNSKFPIRINNRPEVVIVTLKAE